MPNAHPNELRERAVRAYEAGEGSYEEVAERFEIGSATLERWVRRFRNTGTVIPSKWGGGNFSQVDLAILEAAMAERRDATSFELTAAYNKRVPPKQRTSRSSIRRALIRAGYVFKKNAHGRRSATARKSS
jgi:transposase